MPTVNRPGINTKPRTLMDVRLGDRFTQTADTAPELAAQIDAFKAEAAVHVEPITRKPVRQKRRYGLRLLLRRACYFVLART